MHHSLSTMEFESIYSEDIQSNHFYLALNITLVNAIIDGELHVALHAYYIAGNLCLSPVQLRVLPNRLNHLFCSVCIHSIMYPLHLLWLILACSYYKLNIPVVSLITTQLHHCMHKMLRHQNRSLNNDIVHIDVLKLFHCFIGKLYSRLIHYTKYGSFNS